MQISQFAILAALSAVAIARVLPEDYSRNEANVALYNRSGAANNNNNNNNNGAAANNNNN